MIILVLSILLYTLTFILLMVILALLVPIEYDFSGHHHEGYLLKGNINFSKILKISFLKESKQHRISMHLIGMRIPLKPRDTNKNIERKNKKLEKTKKIRKSKKHNNIREYLKPSVIKQVIRTVLKMLHILKPHKFEVNASVGFDDPYVTGMCFAFLQMLHPVLNQHNIELEPIFTESVLVGKFSIQGRVILGRIALVSLLFLLSKPIRSTFKKNKGVKQHVI